MRVGKVEASNKVIDPTPLRPATWAANSSETVRPVGAITPMPVTTTRLDRLPQRFMFISVPN
jgi:hypothetical protein